MGSASLVNLAPLAWLAGLGSLRALGPLAWVWWRQRGAGAGTRRLRALTVLTLFLTFDLVLFGAFTRLTDAGLGCPDWPGCYGAASPHGAHAEISAAQSVQPSGPVTHGKAWIEMVHRYLAMTVGVLIIVLLLLHVARWLRARHSGEAAAEAAPGWALATLLWVCVQGAFGALTVTLKLYPAIVTAHLLGGLTLLALLAVQADLPRRASVAVAPALRAGIAAVALLALGQIVLGAWVSTNYAVLACQDFPTCQGVWWPHTDFQAGFTLLRPLGGTGDGGWLPFEALTAIHLAHRLGAVLLLAALALLIWRLVRVAALRRLSLALAGIAAWQVISGVSNVVLGWPIVAAVAHTAGAALLVLAFTALLARTRPLAPAHAATRAGKAAVLGSAS